MKFADQFMHEEFFPTRLRERCHPEVLVGSSRPLLLKAGRGGGGGLNGPCPPNHPPTHPIRDIRPHAKFSKGAQNLRVPWAHEVLFSLRTPHGCLRVGGREGSLERGEGGSGLSRDSASGCERQLVSCVISGSPTQTISTLGPRCWSCEYASCLPQEHVEGRVATHHSPFTHHWRCTGPVILST